MKLFKPCLLLALVFLAGLVVGVIGTRVAVRHVVRDAILHPEKVQAIMERNLTRRLRLDGGQQTKLHEILSGAQGEMKDLRREYQPQVFAVVSNANGRIVAILTPEQQAKFEKLKADKLPILRALEQNH